MGIIDQILRARSEFRFYLQRQLRGPSPTKTIQYYSPSPRVESKQKPIPLFGSDPTGFGQDYLQVKSVPASPVGPRPDVSPPTVNRSGSVADLTCDHYDPKPETQEERHARLSFEKTDQKIVSHGSMTNWDGQVRNVKTSSSSPSALRGTRQPTSADLHAKDLKENYGYDFSG